MVELVSPQGRGPGGGSEGRANDTTTCPARIPKEVLWSALHLKMSRHFKTPRLQVTRDKRVGAAEETSVLFSSRAATGPACPAPAVGGAAWAQQGPGPSKARLGDGAPSSPTQWNTLEGFQTTLTPQPQQFQFILILGGDQELLVFKDFPTCSKVYPCPSRSGWWWEP